MFGGLAWMGAPMGIDKSAPIYMDNHATTPVDPRVLEAMLPYFSIGFGNSTSRSHVTGWAAEAAVARARAQVAALIDAYPDEIVFTSGATESNNLAIRGMGPINVVTTAIEHKSVLETVEKAPNVHRWIALPVDSVGLVSAAQVERAIDRLSSKSALVSVMLANNEVGTIEPISAIAALCHRRRAFVHTDATQGVGRTPFRAHDVDMASLSAHKIYGPKGVGALYVRRGLALHPQMTGGGHERGMRSGTLNVPGIVGFGAACEIVQREGPTEAKCLRVLRQRLSSSILRELPGVTVNGAEDPRRLPGNLSLSFAGVDGEALLMALRDVVEVSSGSACTSASSEPSYVLTALGVPRDLAFASIRFGLGRLNTAAEVDEVAAAVVRAVRRLRS